MKAECTDSKTFRLKDNDQLLGELTYKNLFSYKAEIKLEDSGQYKIRPVDFFATGISVTKNGEEIANLKMNWKGQIVISFRKEEFVFKATGVFRNQYAIENKEGKKLIQFEPKFNWSKFQNNYEISYDKKPQDILFVLLGVYAANYYIAMLSGAV